MRAPRYPLHLSVRFRPLGENLWRQAETVNISRSGALLRAARPVMVDTPIEFRLRLPNAAAESGGAEVTGRGRVVRVAPLAPQTAPGFAVAIEEYDFLHAPELSVSRMNAEGLNGAS